MPLRWRIGGEGGSTEEPGVVAKLRQLNPWPLADHSVGRGEDLRTEERPRSGEPAPQDDQPGFEDLPHDGDPLSERPAGVEDELAGNGILPLGMDDKIPGGEGGAQRFCSQTGQRCPAGERFQTPVLSARARRSARLENDVPDLPRPTRCSPHNLASCDNPTSNAGRPGDVQEIAGADAEREFADRSASGVVRKVDRTSERTLELFSHLDVVPPGQIWAGKDLS